MEDLNNRQDIKIEDVKSEIEFCRGLVTRFNFGGIEAKKDILLTLTRTIIIKDGNISLATELPYIVFKKLENKVLSKKG